MKRLSLGRFFKCFFALLSLFLVFQAGATALAHADDIVYDDFNGGAINKGLWNINDPDGVLTQLGGYLRATTPKNGVYGQLHSKATWNGDFDIIMQYSDFQTNASQFGGNHPQISLQINASTPTPGPRNYLYIFRGYSNNYNYQHGFWSSGEVNSVWQQPAGAPSSSTSGQLMITRRGSTVTTHYNEGAGWFLLGTFVNAYTGEVGVQVSAYTGYNGTFSVNVNNVLYLPQQNWAQISGWVTGSGGGGLANVPVNVNGNGWGIGGCTNADGTYTITGISPGSDYRISAGGRSWCNQNEPVYAQVFYGKNNLPTPDYNSAKLFPLNAGEKLSGINFPSMALGAEVSGRVTGPNGGLANVPVNVSGNGWGAGGCTTSDGSYTISGIYPGDNIRVSAGGTNWCIPNGPVYAQVFYAEPPPPTPSYNAAKQFTLVSEQKLTDINFSGLVIGAAISGQVTSIDPVTTQSVGLANVPVNVSGNGWGAGGCTASDGSYTITGIYPGGPYRISAGGGQNWCGGPNYGQIYYNSQGNTPYYSSAQEFTLHSGDVESDIDFPGMLLGATVRGKVTGVGNTPLEKIPVNVSSGPGWGMGGCTDANGEYAISGLYPSTGNPRITYKISAGGQNWCPEGPYYKQIFYDNKPNYDTADPVTLISGDNVYDFSGLVPVTSISGDLQGDLSNGVQNLVVVLHDSQDRLVDFRTNFQNTHYVFENLNPGTSYTIKVYDPFLNYQNTQGGPITVSSGMLNTLNISLNKLTPSGSPPSLKSDPLVFVYRGSDNNEYLNLVAEINDPSGCQPSSIKSVTVVDPAGKLHYLYHQKYQALVDQGAMYADYWQNSRDNSLSNFTTLVGNYTFTILDVEGNRVSRTVRLDTYSTNKLSLLELFGPAQGSQVDLNNSLTLDWNLISGAAFYQVRILEGGELIYKGHNSPSNSFIVPPGVLLPGRLYTWYVMAWDKGNINDADYVSISYSKSFSTKAQGTLPSSGPLTVKVVPWVSSSPLIPHDAYAGHQIRVKAVTKGGTPPYTYTWDFGDNTSTYTGTSNFNLGATHVYNAISDKLFNATVTVTDSAGTPVTVTATYPIKFWANPTRGVKVNVAIDEALWWLHRNMQLYTSDGKDYAYLPGGNAAGTAAMALQAFVLNGHKPDDDPNNPNPYAETARRAKNYILSQLFDVCIAPEPITGTTNTRNPDSNNNGKGVYVKNGHRLYETGLVLMALSTLQDESLKDTIQDLVDYLAYAQVEPDAGGGRGGWRYDTNYRESDMSVTQFPLLGLEAAEYHMSNMGVTIPGYIKEELRNNFLYFVQNKEQGGSDFGGFGYSWPNGWVNVAKTGAGIVGLALTGFDYSDTRVASALQFINAHWDDAIRDQWNNEFYNIGDLYAMYAVMKGMKSYEMRGANTSKIGEHDWYDKYAQWAILNQQLSGNWQSSVNSYGPFVDTLFGVLLLLPQVFDIGPTAVAQASPTQVETGQVVTFSHSGSFHRDSRRSIVSYAWDFNGDGTPDWTTTGLTDTFTYSYASPGTYSAILTVTDTAGLIGTDQVTIIVNWPPVINPIGNKTVIEGELLRFTVTGSDPDGNILTFSASGLPTGATFDTGTQTFSWIPGFGQAGTYPGVRFTVTDNGVPKLSAYEAITIMVFNAPPVPVTIKIEPETFNLGAKGVFTAFITLLGISNYTLANIDTLILACEGAPVVNTNMAANKLIAKFNVEDLSGVPVGDKVTLTVTGRFKDGRPFKGFDTIRVISKK